MADTAVVGILRTMLMMDTASFESGVKKAVSTTHTTEKAIGGLTEKVKNLTPLAERMVKSLGGDKLLYTANSLTAAVTKLGGAQKLTEAEQAKVNRTLDAAIQKYKQLGAVAPKAMVDLEKATRGASSGVGVLSTRMVALGAFAGTVAAQLAGQALRGVINMGREAFESAGKILDLANATGLSAKTIQQMQFVAGQADTALESFTTSAFNLGRNIAGGDTSVVGALHKLGIEWATIRGLSMDQQWNIVAVALSKLTDEGERNRIGTALMGRGFKDVAKSIGADYEELTRQVKTATDAQLRELDRLNNEWTKFRRNVETGFGAEMGRLIQEWRLTKEVRAEAVAAVKAGKGRDLPFGLSDADIADEVQRRIRNEALTDITLSAEHAAGALKNYSERLAAVRAELGKLTPAERAEIAAAQALGVSATELEQKFGLSDGALSVYAAGLRAAEKDTKSFTKSQKELAEEAAKANEIWFDVQVQMDRAMLAREQSKRSPLTILSDLQHPHTFGNEPPKMDDAIAELQRLEKAESDWRAFQNFLGERAMEDEAARLEERKRRYQEFANSMRGLFAPLLSSVTGGLGSLLFGDGSDDGMKQQAQEAKAHFEELKKNGKTSAEELTRAFQAWREAESRSNSAFAERFKQLWQGIRRALVGILNSILSHFVNQFLGGMIKGLVNSAFGQRIGNWFAQALGFGPMVASAAGVGAAAAIPGAAAAPSVAALLGAPPAAAAAGGGAGAGLGATIGALATNPITIAGAGVLALWATGALSGGKAAPLIIDAWKRGASTWTDPSGKVHQTPDRLGRLERGNFAGLGAGQFLGDKPVGSFKLGGFVPPNITMPAILHGGSMGEAIVPLEKIQKHGDHGEPSRIINVHATFTSLDPRTAKKIFREEMLPELRMMMLTDATTRGTVREAALT